MTDRLAASGITRKEAEVLSGLGEQLTNAEIARRMYVSERTVESHVSSLLRKLPAANRRELGRLAAGAAESSTSERSATPTSDTITFLFTDIESSTALWERHPRLMPQALARHDEALRTAIAGHGGRVFATAGDGLGAAFASASEAVAGAADAQRSLISASWPGNVAVHVRMGLHTGTATQRGGDYLGGAVNRAARIAAGGRGGQILLSAATAHLVADDGWSMVDLGLHRLKGLERPERILRVDVPGLPVVDLPLRVGRQRSGNLPHESSGLVGREGPLTELTDALELNRLVTITGPGGVGKTRLAIAAAVEVANRFPDGVWLVELDELRDPADIAPAVATGLGLQPSSGAHRVTSTVAAMVDQHALVVLDNCEHLIDGVAMFVAELGSRCARVVVLATSREPLGLGHELRFGLQPLGFGRDDLFEARQLFCQRAAGVLGHFEPSDADLIVIDDICRRLDGLPLAIELATARLSAMSLPELLTHLSDRFEILTRRRGPNPRQRSLRATLAWSYNLLTPDEQSFLDQLSVFTSDFGAPAARAVSTVEAMPVEDFLMSLVDKSLLCSSRRPVGTRFRQLETVRQYGRDRLDASGGRTASMRRLLDHYVGWAESADTGIKSREEQHWHDAFTAEWPNLREAFRWACDVDDGDAACRLVSATLWWATSRMRLETERWCELAIDLPSTVDHPLRPAVLAGAALFAHMREDGETEQRFLLLAHAEEERLGPATEPWVPAALLNQWNGGPAAALRDAAELRRRAERVDDEFWLLAAALGEAFILATLLHGAHMPDNEADHLSRIRSAVDRAEAFGQPSGIACATEALGIALRRADPPTALVLLERALDLCGPLGVEDISSSTRHELAAHYTQLGRPRDALTLMHTAIPQYLRSGAWHALEAALTVLPRALADVGRPEVGAIVLGCLGRRGIERDRDDYQLDAADDVLVGAIGAKELEVLRIEGSTRPLGDVAQLVVKTIDELLA